MMPLLLLPASVPAIAAPAPPAAEQRLSVVFGTSDTYSSSVRVKQPALGTNALFDPVHWTIQPWQATIYYTAQYTHFLPKSPRLGVLFDFTHNKAIIESGQTTGISGTWNGQPVSGSVPLNDYIQKLRFTNGVNMFTLGAVYRGAGPGSRFEPYIAAGPTYYLLWARSIVDNVQGTTVYRGAGFGYLARGGVRYEITPRLSVQAELTYSEGPAAAYLADNGRLTTHLRSVHRTLGLSYRL